MQGVHDSNPIADLTSSQMGVLLTFQPVSKGYITDNVVLSNLRKALLHCLLKVNNTAPDSQTNKRFTNLLTALPFLFLQSSAFDKLQLRERSEYFKNLIIEGKTDDILVGDVKKKTSTAHSMLKRKYNFKDRQHNEADKHARAQDYGKALAALQKIDYPVVPENFLQCAKDSLPQRKTDVLSQEDRDLLFTKVNSNIAAILANPKSLEKTLFRMKKNPITWC